MPLRTDTFDLSGLRLSPGEGRHLDLHVTIDPLTLAGERYAIDPPLVAAAIDLSRTTGPGYALRLRLQARLAGPCMRCLEPAELTIEVDAREVSQPGAGEDMQSPYVRDEVLDLRAWARDSLALSLPGQVRCRPDCAGLCPVCGVDLNVAEPGHAHAPAPDPRWAKLSDLRLD